MMAQVITANRLRDGLVVYLTGSGSWSERVGDSVVVRSEDEAERRLAIAAASVTDRHVVDPYLIDIVEGDSDIRPKRFREQIRAFGPPIHPEFARPGWGA